MEKKLILSIESSCDETSAAVIENGRIVLSNIIATQIDTHKIIPHAAGKDQRDFEKTMIGNDNFRKTSGKNPVEMQKT